MNVFYQSLRYASITKRIDTSNFTTSTSHDLRKLEHVVFYKQTNNDDLCLRKQ